MAECIIARGGGRSDGGSSGPPIIADKHTILVTVTDSDGVIINDLSVHCKDGDNWYNYHTNDKGQVLFVTNSGAANITAWNFSINGNYKYIDQIETNKNIDAPVGLSTLLNLSLGFQTSEISFTSMTTNIYQKQCYSGNYKVRVANYVNVFAGGAGGGGVGATSMDENYYNIASGGCGGAGGGIAINNGVVLNHTQNYLFYIGSGGKGSGPYDNGITGGSTSAFNTVATGGEGGRLNYTRALEGNGTYGGGNGGTAWIDEGTYYHGANSKYSNWGGGGGGGETQGQYPYETHDETNGGNPYGAKGGSSTQNGYSAKNGGGGGGAGGRLVSFSDKSRYGGTGGGGKLSFTFY